MVIVYKGSLLTTTQNAVEAQTLLHQMYAAHNNWVSDGRPQSGG